MVAEPLPLQEDVCASVELVTPGDAQRWLTALAPNRRLDWNTVYKMARDMKAGHWVLTHQGIAFDSEGFLLDGQHRLRAVVLADVSVPMMVSRNLPRGAQLVMDDHRKRSGADVLSIETGAQVSTLVVALLALMERPQTDGRLRYSKAEIRDAYQVHGRAVRFVEENLKGHVRGVTIAPILAPAARAWYTQDRARLAEFLVMLSTGIPQHTPDDTAALRLRDWCMGFRDARQRPTRVDQFRRAQNALRHFLEKRDVTRLQAVDTDLFPVPEDLLVFKSLAKLEGK